MFAKGEVWIGKRIHRNDEINRRFLQVGKILLSPNEKLSEGAILAYSILRDRLDLSKANSDVYTDSEGFLYVIYTDEELGYILSCTRQTANARKKS
nr:replication initiator protein A [Heyndrickxia oleronia]